MEVQSPHPPARKGKPKAKKDPRNFTITDYLISRKINIPLRHDWSLSRKLPWGILGNNTLENCTCAAAGHMIRCWTANTTSNEDITEDMVIQAYIALSNYDPVTGANNEGVYMLDALKYWRKTGIQQHRISMFAILPEDERQIIKVSIFLFGGIYVGLLLPLSAVHQDIWDVAPGGLTGDNAPESYGGHAVAILAYDEHYLTCITMGEKKKMTWAFWETYHDEAYAIVTEDFLKNGETPLGFDVKAMERDLRKLSAANE